MAFEVPHKHDISLDGQEMRNQMIENFEAIEHEDQQDDQALEEKISQSEERLTKRITALEDMLFGQRPQEVKMAENSTPPLANGGTMLINLTSKEDK